MNARVFLVVALAVILLFKNAKTPGAFLRHQVGGQGLRGGGLGGRLLSFIIPSWLLPL